MLDLGAARARRPIDRGSSRRPTTPRLAEYRPEARALPRFFVWTLGCQMNRSDSEEMAGRLLAGGCEAAPALDDADLIVINTCAIREQAEQKVIGRQGHLARLKAANPALRVVMTGCSVREPDRAGLATALSGGRPVPAARRGARARRPARAGVGAGADRRGSAGRRRSSGARRRSGGRAAGDPGARRGRRNRRTRVGDQRVAPDHLRLRQDLHVLHRAVQPRPGAQPAVRRDPRRGTRPCGPGYREVTLLGQNVNSYGHDLAPDPRFGHVATERWAGRRLELADGRTSPS